MRLVLFGAGAGAAIALIWGAAIAALIAWNYAAHKRPAGGEPPPTPRGGESRSRPGLRIIPPPPVTHPGKDTRLILIRDCGGGHCVWAWRPATGWEQACVCTPLPTPGQWQEWLDGVLEEGQ